MGQPAVRIGDDHICPAVTPGTPPVPHVGGPIIGIGNVTVLIEGQPAATTGDTCLCTGATDKIVMGSSGVLIGGKPAARMGDQCAHGGVLISGAATVLIGERMGNIFFAKPRKLKEEEYVYVEPTQEEKNKILEQAIKECIALLERKLKLMERRSRKTMRDFRKWFGRKNIVAYETILERVKKSLDVARTLTVDNFEAIEYDFDRARFFAQVIKDRYYTIYLGDPFWDEKEIKRDSKTREEILIHELSHFINIGDTKDFDYGEKQCLYLSKNEAHKALQNAENYEFFIKA